MLAIIVLALWSHISHCAKPICVSEHSNAFDATTDKSTLFIRDSYMEPGENGCNIYENAKFREYADEDGIYDSSKWQVEHIIDIHHSELPGCPKNILGNMILANRTWNAGVGNLCWKHASAEKLVVYGEIFAWAHNWVTKCCGITQEKWTDPNIGWYSFGGLLGLFVLIIIANVVILCRKTKKQHFNDFEKVPEL